MDSRKNSDSSSLTRSPSFPPWLKRSIAHSGKQKSVTNHINCSGLHTVCVEAKCPNRSECYSRGVATFLIMGNICSRNCSFCSVNHGKPDTLDLMEPIRVVEAARKMELKYVVVTSVTRDDLKDGGAGFYCDLVQLFRKELPSVFIELLIPDFKGDTGSIDTVIGCKPDVLNHNIETVPRLYPTIRPQAQYKRSLSLLNRVSSKGLIAKSGIMVGLGESEPEVLEVMSNLRENGCSILTIGQYLRPSRNQVSIKEFITPQLFDYYAQCGREMGFRSVFAGPYVRSSYRAAEILQKRWFGATH